MRYVCLFFALLSLSCMNLVAQNPADIAARTNLDTRFAPFYHGVASGDPLSDGIIIWTRVTPDTPGPVSGTWKMATDTAMANVVQTGTFSTNDSMDYTVKVDVTGLQAGTWYYYQFETNNRFSLTGRTYTAPVGDVDSLRFAIVSCSRYGAGYFNVYGRLAQRNDIHAVIHLGDYIYEDGDGETDREHEPDHEIINLEDYRMRHSQYKMDEDLRCMHQMYPIIVVWDDHETANNSWSGGAENHGSSEGPWTDRVDASVQAYYEWMPIRQVDASNPDRIYRTLPYGDLMDFIMMDTRLISRDEQSLADANDPNRNLIGPTQLAWLSSEMSNTDAQWKILGQQVMMAPLEIPFVGPVNSDQWDGYAAERQRLYDSILTKNIEDVVVLTGDIHTFWANDLPGSNYDANSGSGSIAVEFVCTSVTSSNTVVNWGEQVIQLANPHMKYINLEDHGYLILDVNKQRTQADYYIINDIDNPQTYGDSEGPHYYVNDLERHLNSANSAAAASPSIYTTQPSKTPPNSSVGVSAAFQDVALLGLYPNPFDSDLIVNYYLHRPGQVNLSIIDYSGKIVLMQDLGKQALGLKYVTLDLDQLAAGMYLFSIQTPAGSATRRIVKR